MALKPHKIRVAVSLVLSVFLLLGILSLYTVSAQTPQEAASDKKADLERQLEQLEQEAAEFDRQLQGARGETQTLANEMKKIDSARRSLATGLFFLYLYDHENVLSALLKNRSLSSFFTTVESLTKVQETIRTTLVDFREDQTLLEKEKVVLQQFREEQQELLALQEVERRFLGQKKKQKDELLRLTKGKEYLFQQLLQAKQKNITTLRTQLFYLEKTGITAEDAIHFAELAANRAGIRPAFLLALLEVETGKQFEEGVISVGSNVGKGNWKDDMYLCYQRLAKYFGNSKYNRRAEREKSAFFEITEKLGLAPDKMPVSKEPPYIGCGGAMGPAQFIPTTWLIFEDRVTALTGNNPPSPWNVEDAFMAAAIFLADAGADSKTAAGETRAAKTYLSGSPSCSRVVCNSYASRILSLARDIDRIL